MYFKKDAIPFRILCKTADGKIKQTYQQKDSTVGRKLLQDLSGWVKGYIIIPKVHGIKITLLKLFLAKNVVNSLKMCVLTV